MRDWLSDFECKGRDQIGRALFFNASQNMVMAFAVLGIFLAIHLWMGHGYPSTGWDFGAHFSIIEELKHGHLFPESAELTINENSVSRYLPIYSGILGAHLLTILVQGLFALSLSKAMLLLSDIATVVTFVCLFRIAKFNLVSKLNLIYILCTQALLQIYQYEFGFYSQTIGISLGYLAFMLKIVDNKKTIWLFVLAAFCYPDILLWILPNVIVSDLKSRSHFRRIRACACGFLFLALISVLLSRLKLSGSAEVDWVSYLALWIIILLSTGALFFNGTFPALTFAAVTLFVLLISEFRFGQLRYYSRKVLYWTPLFYLMVLPFFRWQRFLVLLFLPLSFTVLWDHDVLFRQVSMVMSGSGALSGEEEIEFRDITKLQNCEDGLFLPGKMGLSPALFQMLNALTGRNHVARMMLRSGSLGLILTTDANGAFEKTKSLPLPRVTIRDWNLYCPLDLPILDKNPS